MGVYGWPVERRNENRGIRFANPSLDAQSTWSMDTAENDKKRFDPDTRSHVDSSSAIEGHAMSTSIFNPSAN